MNSIIEFVTAALKEDGATFDPIFGKTMPDHGYMVSVGDETSFESIGVSEVVKALSEQETKIRQVNGFLGVWLEDGEWVFDTSVWVPTFDAAIAVGKSFYQRAVYDIANKESVKI